jgi:hypothetical protein
MEEDDFEQGNQIGTSNLGHSMRSRRARPRVSYVEQFPDDASDQDESLIAEDDSESDVYMSLTTDEESEADPEPLISGDEDEVETASDVGLVDMLDDESIPLEDERPKANPRRQRKTGEATRARKGIDMSLPPLSNIQDCMSDMTSKALRLGLRKALEDLGQRPIRVATMCSGTESPLLALDEISKGLSVLCLSLIVR